MPTSSFRSAGIAALLAAGVTLSGVAVPASAATVTQPASSSSLGVAFAVNDASPKSVAAPSVQLLWPASRQFP